MKKTRTITTAGGDHYEVVTKTFTIDCGLYAQFENELQHTQTTPSILLSRILHDRYDASRRC
jgi:hypothetical protein